MSKDYYSLLGVPKDASEEDIRKAFRKLAKEHHPDMTGGDAEKFKEINEAYQVLSNKDKRAKYDRFGPGFEQMGGGNPFGGFGGGAQFDFGNAGDVFGDIFGGAFGDIFGGGGASRGPKRGRHIEMDLKVTFLEAAFGVEKNITLRKELKCDACHGSGAEKDSKLVECKTCHGSGQVRRIQQTILGSFQSVAVCSDCEGQGRRPEKACKACGGEGIVKGQKEISIKVPAGINDGEILRVSGEGEAMPHGGASGDLYLTVRIAPDKRFARDGFDVTSIAELPFSTAALGGSITVETIDGPVELKIPAGTPTGQVFRLKNRGIPFLKRSGRGDHHVEVIVQVPTKLTKGQRKALEDWENL